MINVTVDHNDLDYVRQRLGDLEDQAPRTLKNAVNKTARETRKRLAEKAQERYTVKSAGFSNHTQIQNATLSNLNATIRVKGRTLTLPRFHVTHPKRSGVRAEVLKGGGLKTMMGSRKIKAFLATVSTNGTKMVLQRKGKSRYPLKGLHGVSVPKMLEKVYDGKSVTDPGLKAEIERMYYENVEEEIGKVLNGG